MLPVIQIGPLTLQTPGLVIIIGIWLALTAVEHYARKIGRDDSQISNLALVALVSGILGARLSFAASNIAAFQNNLASLFSLSPTMLDPIGGMAVGVIAAFIYGQRRKLSFWDTLDVFTPGFAIFMIFLGVSNLASGNGYGTITNLPWGISLWDEKRHPVQIYSILTAGIIYFLLVFRFRQKALPAGGLFLAWLSMTSFASIFIETFRGDSMLLAGGVRTWQVFSWVALAGALFLLGKRLRGQLPDPEKNALGPEEQR